ncbi:MAG: hypothetical protein ABFR90_11890 [Planctomycetota bacterium]
MKKELLICLFCLSAAVSANTAITFFDGTVNGGTMTTLADGTALNYMAPGTPDSPDDVEVWTSGYGDADGTWM